MNSPTVKRLEYAGFWRRFLATIIDFILLLSLLIPFYLLIQGLPVTVSSVVNHWLFNLIWFLALIGFWAVMGATPGKRLLNCKVVKINNDQSVSDLTLKQASLRALAYIISMVPLYIGFLWIGFDKRKRGFHDMLLNTVVIIAEEHYEDDSIERLLASSAK